jgi:rubrerythrin
MEVLENLPRKCFSCNICQKFVPSIAQEKECTICGHMDEVHEQVSLYLILVL